MAFHRHGFGGMGDRFDSIMPPIIIAKALAGSAESSSVWGS